MARFLWKAIIQSSKLERTLPNIGSNTSFINIMNIVGGAYLQICDGKVKNLTKWVGMIVLASYIHI